MVLALPLTLPGRPLLTITQAMSAAAVSRRTIYNWIRLGKIQWVYTAGGQRRIYADSLFTLTKGPVQ